ncbi:hypothetical protein Vadar_006425 [Vaccinium darrowii]|uniref:Uncharacterized protein n=1 Tax=Vaccinium darrowii TaxID=229202 RepID=A0ACB7XYH0_9ERIC|nr:hypothetical protein Vadar_006425 [Vaccinium darrowii]
MKDSNAGLGTWCSPTVFVDNLPHQIRKIWVFNLFSRYGKIKDIFIPNKKSKISGQSFGFVRFFRRDEATFAVKKLNNTWCWNRRLDVKFAKFLKKEGNIGVHGEDKEDGHLSKTKGDDSKNEDMEDVSKNVEEEVVKDSNGNEVLSSVDKDKNVSKQNLILGGHQLNEEPIDALSHYFGDW